MKVFELTSRRIAPLVLLCCFVCLSSPSLHAQDFKYTDFSSTNGLSLNGNAAGATNGSGAHVLRITPAVASPSQVGSAWFCGSDCSNGTGQELLAQGFSTTFKFQLSGNNTEPAFGPADGFAFVIQSGPNSCFAQANCGIAAVDPTSGATLGYDGLTSSLAVEFDTFCDAGDSDLCNSISTANGTSTANEVGIQSCGFDAPNTANHDTCGFGQISLATLFFVDGASAATTLGSKTVTLTGANYTAAQMQNMVGLSFVINGLDFGLITATNATNQTLTLATVAPSTQAATGNYAIEPVLADGNVHTVTIMYTPPTSCGDGCINPNLTVTLDGNVVLSTGIDIVENVLGGTDGALVGFTGSTANGDDNQDILAWSYDTAQTNFVTSTGPGTAFYSFDGGNDTWTINYVGLPVGAQLTGFRTETTQAEWAQRVAGGSYSKTTLAPILAPGFIATGDGAVFSLLCTQPDGTECNPNPAQPYTLTALWNSSDNNYPSENPGLLKAHPIGADNWADILLLSFNAPAPQFDPLPTNKGGSKTPCSDYANVSGVTGTPPAVTITSPADGSTYTPNQIVDANFSCSGNPVTGCVGLLDALLSDTPVILGAPVDTSVNGSTHTFSVIADVSSGPSGTASATYFVSSGLYGVQLLYASNRAVKSGADFPIKMYLTNSSGMDVSSSTLTVHALQVIMVSTNISDTVTETGGSNPDLDFRFDGTQGPNGGYIFNLKTTGLKTGQYVLQFQVSGDNPSTARYTVPFAVK
jgi:lectin family protein